MEFHDHGNRFPSLIVSCSIDFDCQISNHGESLYEVSLRRCYVTHPISNQCPNCLLHNMCGNVCCYHFDDSWFDIDDDESVLDLGKLAQ